MDGQPSAQSAAVELHVRLGAEGVEDLLALIVSQLVEGELVVVAHEVGPLARQVECRSLPKRLGDRAGVAAGEREVDGLHPDEVELHVEPVAVRAAEERLLVLVRKIHLAEQDGVAEAAGDEVADVAEVLVGVEHAGICPARRPWRTGTGRRRRGSRRPRVRARSPACVRSPPALWDWRR